MKKTIQEIAKAVLIRLIIILLIYILSHGAAFFEGKVLCGQVSTTRNLAP